ncbi:MAG: hypothetical protein ACREEB_15845 [Caulobacteraceae bacterium]
MFGKRRTKNAGGLIGPRGAQEFHPRPQLLDGAGGWEFNHRQSESIGD